MIETPNPFFAVEITVLPRSVLVTVKGANLAYPLWSKMPRNLRQSPRPDQKLRAGGGKEHRLPVRCIVLKKADYYITAIDSFMQGRFTYLVTDLATPPYIPLGTYWLAVSTKMKSECSQGFKGGIFDKGKLPY